MQFFIGKALHFANRFHNHTATPDPKLIVKDLASSFLILIISLSLLITLLVPNVPALRTGTIFSQGAFVWALTATNILLLLFLLAVSLFLLAQSLIDYRNTRDLDRSGVITKGLLIDKWVDVSDEDEKPVYWVRYEYLTRFQAVQAVDKDVYQRLKRAEMVHILHLEKSPYISRLDLGG